MIDPVAAVDGADGTAGILDDPVELGAVEAADEGLPNVSVAPACAIWPVLIE